MDASLYKRCALRTASEPLKTFMSFYIDTAKKEKISRGPKSAAHVVYIAPPGNQNLHFLKEFQLQIIERKKFVSAFPGSVTSSLSARALVLALPNKHRRNSCTAGTPIDGQLDISEP